MVDLVEHASGLLRRHVVGRADDRLCFRELGVRGAHLRDAEIEDLREIRLPRQLDQEHVRRLEVTVNDALLVCGGQGRGNLPGDVHDGGQRQLAELRNQSETLIYTTEQALEGYADLLDPAKAASVKENLDSLRLLLDSGAEVDTLREAYATLENATYEIAEAIYGGGAS